MLAGKPLGRTPFHGALPREGRDVTLVFRLPGYLDKTAIIRPDKPITLNIKLVRAPSGRPRPDRDSSVNPFAN